MRSGGGDIALSPLVGRVSAEIRKDIAIFAAPVREDLTFSLPSFYLHSEALCFTSQ